MDTSELHNVPFGLAQLAEIDAVCSAPDFARGKLLPEFAVAAFAELALVEVIVDQCAQVEQATQGPTLFWPQRLSARSRHEIERHDAKSPERRPRPLPLVPRKTGCRASGHMEEGAQNHRC